MINQKHLQLSNYAECNCMPLYLDLNLNKKQVTFRGGSWEFSQFPHTWLHCNNTLWLSTTLVPCVLCSLYTTSQAAIQFAPTSKPGRIAPLNPGCRKINLDFSLLFKLKQWERAKTTTRGLHPAPQTCCKVLDSCQFRVWFYTRSKWLLLPTFRESSKAGGALAETELFSNPVRAQVPSNNTNSLCLLRPVQRRFLQSADVKIKQTQLRWLGHTAKTKCHRDGANAHGLIPLHSIASSPSFFPAHLWVACK